MSIALDEPSTVQAQRSEVDRRAIALAGHLLMAGIWVERQLKDRLGRRIP
jgi:hypothetical protein